MIVAKFPAGLSVQMNAGAKVLSIQSGLIVALIDPNQPIITRQFHDRGTRCIGNYMENGKLRFLFE